MTRHALTALAATLTVLSLVSLGARAETVSRTLDGQALSIELVCVDQVEILPQPGLAGQVTVKATSSGAGELADFVFAGGDTASVTRQRRSCTSSVADRPKTALSIRVPAGMPIDIRNGGATDYTIGAVGGPLHARLAGAGNIAIEAVSDLDLTIAGSSEARIGQVGGGADIQISGRAEVRIARGEISKFKVEVNGSGRVSLEQGRVGTLTASIAGSGHVRVDTAVQDATLSSIGSGTIEVAKVTGTLSTSKVGSGSIITGHN